MSRTFAPPEHRPASAGATPVHKAEAGSPFRSPDVDGSVGPVVQRKCDACAALGTKDNGPPSHPVVQRKCDSCAKENAAASAGFGFDLSKILTESPARARASENLAMGLPGDPAEQEADRVAERVMRMPGLRPPALTEPVQPSVPGNIVQRLFARRDAEEAMLRRQLSPAAISASAISPIVRRVLGSQGQPLDPTARTFFEPRFGYDFSKVRVHADAAAAESAQSVNALAYTVGRDIVFGAGRYQPESSEGRTLLAHELTHVVQQQGGATSVPIAHDRLDQAQDPYECEADNVASSVLQGHRVELGVTGRPPAVQMRIAPEDVSVEMVGREFELLKSFSVAGMTPAAGTIVRAMSWTNNSETAMVEGVGTLTLPFVGKVTTHVPASVL